MAEHKVHSRIDELFNSFLGLGTRGTGEYKVHLAALDLEVPVSTNVSYSDDGYQTDLNEYCNNFAIRQGAMSMSKLPSSAQGCCDVAFTADRRRAWVRLFYLKQASPELDTHVRAHEETHFLHAIGKLDYLSQVMNQRVGLSLDFKKVQEYYAGDALLEKRREIIAELGGIFGVHQLYGFDSARNIGLMMRNRYIGTAWQIYESTLRRSREKARNFK
ncbi:hypothetical protein KA107_00300 [Candidatus Pacearchaeota archaeon]|nr:hypothetical protein [Candidatus Pacearchaeota archaeon]